MPPTFARSDGVDGTMSRSQPAQRLAAIEEGIDEVEFFIAEGLYDDARTVLRELLNTYPEHPLLKARLSEVNLLADTPERGAELSQTHRLADAAFEGDDVIDLDDIPTGSIEASSVLEQFKLGVGESLSVEDCDARYDLGVAYREMGLLDDAIAEFKLAVTSVAHACVGELMIGRCYRDKGDAHSAIAHLRLGLQAERRGSRDETEILYELGDACEATGDRAGAQECFQRVVARDPAFRDVRDRLGRLGR